MLKIISGGQTVADAAGLVAAKRCGLETGGFAASNFMTEDGVRPDLAKLYGLVDKKFNYSRRTVENVKAADVTIIFADDLGSPGTKLTISACCNNNKPYIINPTSRQVVEFIETHKCRVINVAGNRESVSPGITARVEKVLMDAFRRL